MKFYLLSITLLLSLFYTNSNAQEKTTPLTPAKKRAVVAPADYPEITKTWEGSTFSSKKSIDENILDVKQLTNYATFFTNPEIQNAIAAQKMVTVFIVPNTYFDNMNKKHREAFMADANSENITKALMTMIVPGRLDSKTMAYEIEKRGGKPITLKTLSGEILEVSTKRDDLIIKNETGQTAKIEAADFSHLNGFFHIADALLISMEAEK